MASSIGNTVVITPVTVPEGEALLSLPCELDTQPLTDVLTKMSQTIAKNAKAANATADDVVTLRNYVDAHIGKLQRTVNVADDTCFMLKEQLARLGDELRSLKASCIHRDSYEADRLSTTTSLRRCEQFVDETETGGGERVQKFVRSFVEAYVPRWYEPISQSLWGRITTELERLDRGLRQNALDEIGASEHQMRQSLDEQHTSLEQQLLDTAAAQDRKCEELHRQAEDRCNALQHSLESLDQQNTSNLQQLRADSVAAAQALARDHDDLLCALSISAEKVRQAAAALRANKVGDPCIYLLSDTPSLGKLHSEFREHSSSLFKEATAVLSQMFDHHRVYTQQSLSDKVGLTTLRKLMAEYRDDVLYNNVKNSMTAIEALSRDKVDEKRFIAAMCDKAEASHLQQKAEKSYVDTFFQHTDHRFRELEALIVRIEKESREVVQKQLQMEADERNMTYRSFYSQPPPSAQPINGKGTVAPDATSVISSAALTPREDPRSEKAATETPPAKVDSSSEADKQQHPTSRKAQLSELLFRTSRDEFVNTKVLEAKRPPK